MSDFPKKTLADWEKLAAKELRDLDPLVLEASDRVGGRIWSRQRGELAMSVGAHMFPPPDSTIGRLVGEYGLEVLPITGSMLNIALGGTLIQHLDAPAHAAWTAIIAATTMHASFIRDPAAASGCRSPRSRLRLPRAADP